MKNLLSKKICYLDIETTGLSKKNDEITMIGIYDGKECLQFVNGINLEEAIPVLKNYEILVTFNGKCFDIPFIELKFNTKIDLEHYDLRFLFKSIGLKGGLKTIERTLGINRDSEVKDINGREAVKLWFNYKFNKDRKSLAKLLKYNKEDIINLKFLFEWFIYNYSTFNNSNSFKFSCKNEKYKI